MSGVREPYYRIYLQGKELDDFRQSMIEEVVFEDHSTGSDLLSIRVNDPEFIFLDDDIFIEEAKVKFVGGYSNEYRVMFEGYVSVIDVMFPNTGSPQLTLHCMDNTHVMNRTKKKRTWNNKKRSDVVASIFKEYGFKTVIDPSPSKEETISQSNETDISFLEKLAGEETDHYLVYVEQGVGYYVKKKILNKHQAVLDYRGGNNDIIAFNPRINKEVKQIEVNKANVNTKDKKVDKAKANDSTPRKTSGTSPKTTDRRDNKTKTQNKYKYQGGGKWKTKKK